MRNTTQRLQRLFFFEEYVLIKRMCRAIAARIVKKCILSPQLNNNHTELLPSVHESCRTAFPRRPASRPRQVPLFETRGHRTLHLRSIKSLQLGAGISAGRRTDVFLRFNRVQPPGCIRDDLCLDSWTSDLWIDPLKLGVQGSLLDWVILFSSHQHIKSFFPPCQLLSWLS